MGTGMVGRTLAGRLSELGGDVAVGTRDVGQTLARVEADQWGNPPFSLWQKEHPAVRLVTFSEAASHGETVVNATKGEHSLEVLQAAGETNLKGKILIDVANPLDFSKGMPPTLLFCNTDSLGERIQRAFPDVKVVKALNTTNAAVMTEPRRLADGEHSIFVCGNDAGAKAKVTDILKSFGWRDIIDLGDITAARGTEMVLPIWLRLWGALKTPMFNYKVVR
jgi:hypothetical protein